MASCKKVAQRVAVIAGVALLLPPRVYAYLDPGTGSYLVQVALALALGALVSSKVWWHKVKSFFTRLFRRGS